MNKLIIRNQYVISFIKKMSTIVFGFVSVALISRTIGPYSKGEYDSYMNVINILNVTLYLGISTIYPNFMRNNKTNISTFLALSFVQFILYSLFSIFTYFIINESLYSLIMMCVAFSVFAIQLNNITLVENYIWNAYSNILSMILNCLLSIFVFLFKINNVILLLIFYCLKEGLLSFTSLFFLKNMFVFNEIQWKSFFKIIKNGFIPMITNLLIAINYRIDVIFLNVYNINFYQIGLYTAGLGLAEYAWIIPDIFKDVLINKTAKKDDFESVNFCLRASSTFLFLAFLLLLFFGENLIYLLYGVDYIESYKVTVIVFTGVYGMIFCKLLGTLYLAQGKWNFFCITLLSAVVINIVTNNIFIPIIGIYGAAITTIVSYTFTGLFFLINYKKKYGFLFKNLIFINKKDILEIKSLIVKKTINM